MIDGIITIYKESGYTSHDVVAKLRGILKQKKIGHTGTLDPEAQGVLPVCLGKGTKLCDMLTDHDKTYRAVLRLGVVTDTQDITGNVLSEMDVCCTEAEAEMCIRGFVGKQRQIPPMYSALKVGGKKLCDLARQGIEVERTPREIEISEILIENIELPRVTITVTCSKGTYIRTLCHDIGAALGCGGCMESLLRTRVGRFTLNDSVTLSCVEELHAAGKLDDILIPVDSVFQDIRPLMLNERGYRLVCNGNPFTGEGLAGPLIPLAGECFRVYGTSGEFMAVYRWQQDNGRFVPVKMFYTK